MVRADLPPTIQCRKCNLKITPTAAAESMRRMRIYIQAVGKPSELAEFLLERAGPLCRRCMMHWGAADDLNP